MKDYTKTMNPDSTFPLTFACILYVFKSFYHSHFFQKDKTYQERKEIQVSETCQKVTVAVVF